ncbi:MAG: signal peptidase I [Acidobacteria bacterium RIFCSPLOWO2_12_FULL_67_14b]|nr:MAG: signal peptidase I [Acidobacteria bacterium RIFCSPLOWO2_12_FULL_67_14b]
MAEATFQKSTVREYAESILVAVVLALFVRTFVFQAFKIPTGSMKPNLLVGDHLLVNKFIFAPTASAIERALLPVRDIERGDVVVFKFPEEPDRDFIKRVIGLPGDTLELKNQTVHINGMPLIEPYAHYLFPAAAEGEEGSLDLRRRYGPVTVPDGHYFMMGDNRDDSQDSRYWGFLPTSYVKGRALFIYWSFETAEDGSPSGSLLTSLFSGSRWGRLLHQIH